MHHAHDDYQANEILTAAPAKLHQLLLAGAARKTRQAIHCLENGNQREQATDAVVVALKIMSELMGSLKPAHDPKLAKQVAGEYVFIVKALSEGNLRGDIQMLRDALRILEFQHDTWKHLNEQLQQQEQANPASSDVQVPPETVDAAADSHPPIPPPRILKSPTSPLTAASLANDDDASSSSGGLVLDI